MESTGYKGKIWNRNESDKKGDLTILGVIRCVPIAGGVQKIADWLTCALDVRCVGRRVQQELFKVAHT